MTQPSQRLLDLIASFESFRGTAYICPGGVYTIGFGTTRYADGRAVAKGDSCTREQAAEWLRDEVARIREMVIGAVTWDAPENVIDACTSLAHNIGDAAFKGSTCLKKLNAGDIKGAAAELQRWNKASDPATGKKRVLRGLTARRTAEADILTNGWDGTSSSANTIATIEETKPTLAKSPTVWAFGATAAGGLLAVLPQVLPQAWEQGSGIADQITATHTPTELLVSLGTIVGGLLVGLWRKRGEFNNGQFGSQGR